MKYERAKDLIGNFDKQVLVIGDVMLDRFVWGSVTRFSPEAASCPILDYDHESNTLGGAGNAAMNFASLGAKCVRLVGLVGFDREGIELKAMLMQHPEIAVDDLLVGSPSRPTTVKTRFVSQSDVTHMLRLDHEKSEPASANEQRMLLSKIASMIGNVSGVVLEDYDKGVLGGDFVKVIMKLAAEHNVPVFVDPKNAHWELYKGAELVTPNLPEAYAALGEKPSHTSVEDVGEVLLRYTRAKAIIITRGEDGMSLFTSEGSEDSLPEEPVDVVDVSGAGDTCIAALTLARLAGASWTEAMELGNLAAGIAVGKRGTSLVTSEELLVKFQ